MYDVSCPTDPHVCRVCKLRSHSLDVLDIHMMLSVLSTKDLTQIILEERYVLPPRANYTGKRYVLPPRANYT